MLTVACQYSDESTMAFTIRVKASYDGLDYDTHDLKRVNLICEPGTRVSHSFAVPAQVKYLKVQAKNNDQGQSISG